MRRSPALDRLLIAVLAVAPLALVRPSLTAMSDPDTFWHRLAGEDLLRTGTLVGPDPYPSLATGTWIKHQWLADLVLALSGRMGGWPAVQWWTSVAAVAIFVAAYWSLRWVADPIIAATVSLLAWASASGSIGPRPQVVTFVLLAVTIGTWQRALERGRAPWWLIPVTWLWACCHGFWFLGPVVGLIHLVGAGWAARADPERRRALRPFLVVPALSVVAAALTPLGLEVFLAPLRVSGVTAYITEWARPSFTDVAPAFGLVLLALAVLPWLRPASRPTLTEILTVVVAGYLLFAHARTVGLAGLLLAPLAARHVQRLLPRPTSAEIPEPAGPSTRARGPSWALAIGSIAALTLSAVVLPTIAQRPGRMPIALDAHLAALPAGTIILDDSILGGWLLADHPNLTVGIDTRVEIYDPAYVASYAAGLAGQDTLGLVDRIDASAALLLDGSAGAEVLTRAGWEFVGSDRGFVLLRAPVSAGPS